MDVNQKARILGEKAFLGFQPGDFERGGREQFIYMLSSGMRPDSKVVDVGCGAHRETFDAPPQIVGEVTDRAAAEWQFRRPAAQ